MTENAGKLGTILDRAAQDLDQVAQDLEQAAGLCSDRVEARSILWGAHQCIAMAVKIRRNSKAAAQAREKAHG